MKTLYLLRHAKSDWYAEFETDFDRPLNKRGQKAAQSVGEFLSNAGRLPERILCSSATRTRQTVSRLTAGGNWNKVEIEYLDGLYTGNPKHVLKVVADVPKKVRSVMIVGHETAMSETMGALVGGARSRFPTAAVACIELDIRRWKDARDAEGRLLFFVIPRLLG